MRSQKLRENVLQLGVNVAKYYNFCMYHLDLSFSNSIIVTCVICTLANTLVKFKVYKKTGLEKLVQYLNV